MQKSKIKSFMDIALIQAKFSHTKDEVPIGAVIVNEKGIITAKSGNKNRELNDPTAHAEILAIRMACKKINSSRPLTWRTSGRTAPLRFVTSARTPCGRRRSTRSI